MATLLEKTRPRTSLDFLYPEVEVASLRAWMRSGAAGPALATACSGSGLTTLVRILMRETGLEAVWITSTSVRVRPFLATVDANPVSVTMRRKIVVVDEFDALGSGGETSIASECLSFSKGTRLPMLFLSHWTRSRKSLEFAKKWPVFHMGKPPTKALHAYLAAVCARLELPVEATTLRDVACAARGDVRAALMTLDMPMPGARGARDEAIDPLDLVEDVLRGDRGGTVLECLQLFGMDGAVLPMGLYENYLGCGGADLGVIARVSEGFSVADTVDRYLYSHQAWDFLYDCYGVFSVAVPSLALQRDPGSRKITVTKFGSVWSKVYNACAKSKHLKRLATARMERGLGALDACHLAFVRGMLRCALAGTDDEAVRSVCHPFGPPDVLHVARMDATGDSSWYKQSSHARVKRLLEAPAGGSAALDSARATMSTSARAKKSGSSVPSSRTTGTPA